MLITTGKKVGRQSKLLAAALSLAIPNSRFEPRGKRTAEKLLALAAKRHYSRLCTISEENGKPALLTFLSLGMDGEWKRLSPKIRITSLEFTSTKQVRSPQSGSLSLSGPKKKVLASLFGIGEGADESESQISSSAASIQIRFSGKKILSLGVEYEK